jgi:hypothetical protein
LATFILTFACGDTDPKPGANSAANASTGADAGVEAWNELEYLLPESNVEILPAGEVAEVRIGACSLVNGQFVGMVEATSVSDRMGDVCTGETRRPHRVIGFEVIDAFTGSAQAAEYLTTLSLEPALQPGDRMLVNLLELPNGDYAASAEIHVIPFGTAIPEGFIDATPGHIDLPSKVVDLKAAIAAAVGGECSPGTLAPTNPEQVVGFYTTPREEACPIQ